MVAKDRKEEKVKDKSEEKEEIKKEVKEMEGESKKDGHCASLER